MESRQRRREGKESKIRSFPLSSSSVVVVPLHVVCREREGERKKFPGLAFERRGEREVFRSPLGPWDDVQQRRREREKIDFRPAGEGEIDAGRGRRGQRVGGLRRRDDLEVGRDDFERERGDYVIVRCWSVSENRLGSFLGACNFSRGG